MGRESGDEFGEVGHFDFCFWLGFWMGSCLWVVRFTFVLVG